MHGMRLCGSLLVIALGSAFAQDFPAKPIRVVIPFAAGNTGETSFRLIAPLLESRLGQRLILDNRPGASGNTGAMDAAKSAPDGHTLLLSSTSVFVSNQFLYKSMSTDPLSIFAPITILSEAPHVITVAAHLPVANLRQFQAYAKSNPGKLNFSSSGVGTAPHLSGAMFADLAGIDMVHVPYKGAAQAVLGLLTKEVHITFYSMSAVEGQLRSGHVKALAVAASRRLAALPDVPTMSEGGISEPLLGAWWGMAAPKAAEPRIVERLASEIRAALADPNVIARFAALGMLPGGQSPGEFTARMQTESVLLKKTLEKLKIQPE
ncbi:MAG: Bug family tripartite tricarboxylate transporter substrate binding protein [Burkholderiales bacterium]